MIENVHNHLRGSLEDAIAPRGADEQAQAVGVPNLGRRDAHLVFLGRANGIGAGRLAVEPAHEVVECNAGLRHDHGRAKACTQALGAGDGVAIGVDGVEMGRAFVHPHARVARFDLSDRAAGHEVLARGKLGLVADERAPLSCVLLRQQARGRWVVDGRVGNAIGHGQLGSLDKAVQGRGGVVAEAGHVKAFHDGQRL